jgi:hypothetical protein
MSVTRTVMALSVPILMSLSVSALAARPSLSAHEGRINTLEGQASALTTDLATLAVTPGPQGDKGDAGAAGQAGAAGGDGAKGDVGDKGDAGGIGATGLTGPTGQNGADGATYYGAFEGDMQYWNGNAWIMITAPTENADSLSFCDGQPTWTQGECSPPQIYAVGDVGPAGGWVFHITDGGLHGLEAAPVDQDDGSGAEWGCYSETVPGAFSHDVGSGQANTDLILDHTCSTDSTDGDRPHAAALLADAYTLNNVSDWYLPSSNELQYFLLARRASGEYFFEFGSLPQAIFWSSSQQTEQHARARGVEPLYNMYIYSDKPKYDAHRVRSVRNF